MNNLVFSYISFPIHESSPKEFQKSIKQGILFGLLIVISVLISSIYFMVDKQQVLVYKIQLDNNQIFNQLVVKSLEDKKLSFIEKFEIFFEFKSQIDLKQSKLLDSI